jgi:hypothetical protein
MGNSAGDLLEMENKEFKILFNTIAKKNGFESNFSGWFKESNECIVVLDLQKSDYSNIYYLNIRIYIQGIFGNYYSKNKNLVKNDTGDIFRRQPKEYNDAFDLELAMDVDKRKELLEKLFSDFLNPFSEKVLEKANFKKLEQNNEIYLLPAVKKELGL